MLRFFWSVRGWTRRRRLASCHVLVHALGLLRVCCLDVEDATVGGMMVRYICSAWLVRASVLFLLLS